MGQYQWVKFCKNCGGMIVTQGGKIICNDCKCIKEMKKPVKQMEKKDFEHMHYILNATTELSQTQKADQFIYWQKRVLERIEYIKPLIEECKVKDIDLRVLSLELSNEWIELHTCVDYYNFKP